MPFTVVAFYSSIENSKNTQRHLETLRQSGVRILISEDEKDELLSNDRSTGERILLFIGSGGTERQVIDFLDKVQPQAPVILLSHPHGNSLPAAMEIRTFLVHRSIDAKIIHDSIEHLKEKLMKWTTYSSHLENIRNSRVGLIGKTSSWLIASEVDRKQVHDTWGIQFLEYDLSALDFDEAASEVAHRYIKNATLVSVLTEEIMKATRVADALIRLIHMEKLDAVALQCFSFLMRNGISGCLALCHANNQDGISAGCEGDIPATISMLIAKELTGAPAFMANVTDVRKSDNSVVFAHCTVPTSIVQSYDILTHYESGLSVGIRGRFEGQQVTILKVFGEGLQDYWVGSGSIRENLNDEEGCRTQIRVALDQDVGYFLKGSLGNHHIVLVGDHRAMIDEFLSFVHLML